MHNGFSFVKMSNVVNFDALKIALDESTNSTVIVGSDRSDLMVGLTNIFG